MSYEHSEASAQHSLSLEGRNKMSITSQGELHIRGESLRVDRIDPDMGQVLINGLVQELRYDEAAPSRSLWSRLFG